MSKIRNFILAHKVISTVVVVVIVIGGYYWYNGSQGAVTVTKYVVAQAAQGTIVSSVQGSGQVNAVTSIDVKPQVTETVTNVYVQPGDHVTGGEKFLADPTNEEQALKQAQLSMQSAQLSLAKLQEGL